MKKINEHDFSKQLDILYKELNQNIYTYLIDNGVPDSIAMGAQEIVSIKNLNFVDELYKDYSNGAEKLAEAIEDINKDVGDYLSSMSERAVNLSELYL